MPMAFCSLPWNWALTQHQSVIAQHTAYLKLRRERPSFKSRWVPLSTDGRAELVRYLRKRLKEPHGLQPSAPFLGNPIHGNGYRGWHGFSTAGITRALRTLFDLAGVRGSDGRRPRMHDFRHNSRSRIIPPTHL
jgi:hypothetical protein